MPTHTESITETREEMELTQTVLGLIIVATALIVGGILGWHCHGAAVGAAVKVQAQ